jgi:glycine/D-amino acid oxidase-like deaminating enzyme
MTRDELPTSVDVLVVGAGIIGTAIAARLVHHDLSVCLLDRNEPGSGCSSAGEGNILVSDKLPGPDLALAVRSALLWRELGARLGDDIEFVKKGGLVVAHAAPELTKLISLANEQQAQGVQLRLLNHDEIGAVEPRLSKSVAGGVFYEDDAQVQPMRVVGAHVGEVRRSGGCIVSGVDVLGAEFDSDRRPRSVTTTAGRIRVGTCVVNAAGPWAGELGERLGATVPVTPRRGHVLVTEPVRTITDHKVYDASYVGDVHGGGGGWTVSAVVEATVSGTMLLGSSREFVGFSRTTNQAIVAAIASRAITLFPCLDRVRLMRTYVGFRPSTPDGLPIIGPDARTPGLLHATGHEGAGIGLSEVTAEAIEDLILGRQSVVDLAPYSPSRFEREELPHHE